MILIYIMVLPSEKISKVGTSGRQDWRWRTGSAREEGFVVGEGEGKKDHRVISLTQQSLSQRRSSLREGLCFSESAANPRVQTARVGEVALPWAALANNTALSRGWDLVKFCSRVGGDRFLPDHAIRRCFWK